MSSCVNQEYHSCHGHKNVRFSTVRKDVLTPFLLLRLRLQLTGECLDGSHRHAQLRNGFHLFCSTFPPTREVLKPDQHNCHILHSGSRWTPPYVHTSGYFRARPIVPLQQNLSKIKESQMYNYRLEKVLNKQKKNFHNSVLK